MITTEEKLIIQVESHYSKCLVKAAGRIHRELCTNCDQVFVQRSSASVRSDQTTSITPAAAPLELSLFALQLKVCYSKAVEENPIKDRTSQPASQPAGPFARKLHEDYQKQGNYKGS